MELELLRCSLNRILQFQEWVWPCTYCGRVFSRNIILCGLCWKHLLKFSGPLKRDGYEFRVYSLLNWRDQKVVEHILYELKGGRRKKAFEYLAAEFCIRRDLHFKKAVFVPAPSSRGGEDHASEWAQALVEITGGEMWNCLKRGEVGAQKKRTREQRLNYKCELKEGLTLQNDKQIIFVDDLITTGGTAMSAYLALGKPKDYEVWTIGCRLSKTLL